MGRKEIAADWLILRDDHCHLELGFQEEGSAALTS